MDIQQELAQSYGTTYWIINKFADGLTHADSVAVPDFRANSFNWVLGHILVSRDRALEILDAELVLLPIEKALYATGSELVDAETAVALERLLQALSQSQERLIAALNAVPNELFDVIYDAEKQTTNGNRLSGLHWHETYHTGQLEILRQVNVELEAFP